MTQQNPITAEKSLNIRKQAKRKKPAFVRQESWRYKRLKESWRRPKGLDNKMRRKIKGWPPTVNTGYRGPKVARGLHPSGYKEVLVHNAEEIKEIDPKIQAIRIAHKTGKRKKAEIIAQARKRKIHILNFKEPEKIVEEIKEEIIEEKEEKEKTVKNAEQKKKKRHKVGVKRQ
jgi:large subunit ribosomal protein L32e